MVDKQTNVWLKPAPPLPPLGTATPPDSFPPMRRQPPVFRGASLSWEAAKESAAAQAALPVSAPPTAHAAPPAPVQAMPFLSPEPPVQVAPPAPVQAVSPISGLPTVQAEPPAPAPPIMQTEPSAARSASRPARLSPPTMPPASTLSAVEAIQKRRAHREQVRTIRSFLCKLAVIAALGYVVCTRVFGFAAMKGEQMYPRIRDGDLVVFYRLEDSYTIGDVVTFMRHGVRQTARVVAKGGDTVTSDGTGQLWVNGNVLSEEVFYPTYPASVAGPSYPLVLGDDSLFLLCDMRTRATDSRNYGAVNVDSLDGKVITILRRRGI